MRIGVCIQSLTRVLTTATPYRGMLRELLRLRSADEFELYVTQDSINEPLLVQYLDTLPTSNWRLVPLPYKRRTMALKCLAGLRNYFPINRKVDILLTSDFDYHHFDNGPQIANLNDLSALYAPSEHCSLAWHGRMMRANQARLLVRSETFVTAISQFSQSQLIQFGRRFRARSEVVHCGIEDCWHADTAGHAESPPIKTPCWIWWGQITRRKNIDGLLTAYAALLTSLDPRERNGLPAIVLVGAIGRDSEALPSQIEQLNLVDRVHILPFQDLSTLVRWVDQSSGVLFPSHFEGFGLPALEGLARGKPVMTSDCTSLPEITGGNAILVTPTNTESIVSGLKTLMHADHSGLAVRCRREWASEFTYQSAAKKYSALIAKQLSSDLE